MPEAFERIRRFAERIGCDAPGDLMVQALQIQFVQEKPDVLCIVGLDDAGVGAHFLANIERWAGKTRATVLQMEFDRAVPRSQVAFGARIFLGWAKARGATELQAFAPDEANARRLVSRYGFERKWIILRRSLDLALRAEAPKASVSAAAQNAVRTAP